MNTVVGTAYHNFADGGPNLRTIVLRDSTEAK